MLVVKIADIPEHGLHFDIRDERKKHSSEWFRCAFGEPIFRVYGR